MKNVAIDIGTTTIKCALVENGNILRFYGKEYPLYTDGKTATQNANDWCIIIAEGIKSLGNLDGIRGVSVSAQGITVLPVDGNGKPICFAESWLDVSAEREIEQIKQNFGESEIFAITGKRLLPCYSAPKIKRFSERGIDATKYLMPTDYLNFLLTGEYYTDYTIASGTMLFDVKNRSYNEKLLKFCGITENQLAIPMPFGSKIGTVTEKASKFFGLPNGTAVIMGGQDQKLTAFYCGLKKGSACVTLGTSTAVSVLNGDENYSVFAFDDKDLIYETALNTTGAAIKWLKNLAFISYAEMDAEAEKSGGANGVEFDVDFLNKACIKGLTLETERGNLAYAVYEDIAKKIKKLLSRDINEIVLSGGGAKSKILCDIIAKTTERKVTVPECEETALCGADKCIKKYYGEV